jgi:hypothetical protein
MLSVSLQMRAIRRKHELENPEEVADEEAGRSREDTENPYLHRAPSQYDLPDLR